MKFLNVVGTRPNFMKIAPFQRALKEDGSHSFCLVHTDQHYDEGMSDTFFQDLEMDPPDYHLDVESDTHAKQTAAVMERIEPVIEQEQPDWVVVVGDVNSTLAAGLVASKMEPKLAHIEAGLRSGNRSMPEEVNRVVVDHVSDLLFCIDSEAVQNLRNEGIPEDRIHLVGDIMIDSLVHVTEADHSGRELAGVDLPSDGQFSLLTLHRPSNVDSPAALDRAYEVLREVNRLYPVFFPVHPRTEASLKEHGRWTDWQETFFLLDPLGYVEFVSIMKRASVVLTDSGSIQQETSVLGVPCLTLREETERPVTVRKGTNEVVGWDRDRILECVERIREGRWKKGEEIPLWDGQAAGRILDRFTGVGVEE